MIFLSFNFPFFASLARNPAVFENLKSFQHLAMLFSAYLLRPVAVHQFWCHSLPRMTRAFPAPNQDLSLSIHSSYLIINSKVTLSPFSKIFRQVFWSCAFSWNLHVFAAFSTPHASILVCLSTPLRSMLRLLSFLIQEINFSFGFGLSSSQSFHPSTKQ